jgi:hypothetical protein
MMKPKLEFGKETRKDTTNVDYFIMNSNPKDIYVKFIKIRAKLVGILGRESIEETYSDGDFKLEPNERRNFTPAGDHLLRKIVEYELTVIAEYDGKEYKVSGKEFPASYLFPHESLHLIVEL